MARNPQKGAMAGALEIASGGLHGIHYRMPVAALK